jgi:hypothetical protein
LLGKKNNIGTEQFSSLAIFFVLGDGRRCNSHKNCLFVAFMTTSHQLFLKEKKVDVVILAYLLLFVLLFTSWGQARNHHIPVRCPAKFLNFPQIYFFLFCSAGCQRLLYSSFFYITETAKRHATARYLKKQNLGISAQCFING